MGLTLDDLLAVSEREVAASARESCVAAMRAVFTRTYKAGLVSVNPALLVDKPRRGSTAVRSLPSISRSGATCAFRDSRSAPADDELVKG